MSVSTHNLTTGPSSNNSSYSWNSAETAAGYQGSSWMHPSFPLLKDWFKMLLIGAIFEVFRKSWGSVCDYVFQHFFISAHFSEGDQSYEWIMSWLSSQPKWSCMRDFEISTWSWWDNRTAFTLSEDEPGAPQKLSFIPSIHSTYNLTHRGHWLRLRRRQAATGPGGRMEHVLHLSVLTRDSNFIITLLSEAHAAFKKSQDNQMWIYTASTENEWVYSGSRKARSVKSIVLDPGIKELLLSDAKDFLSSWEWYKRRGIPFRRGYLLYGPPGSGKTSTIHAVAGELKLNIYIISLSSKGLDDNGLTHLINALPDKCVAIMEDIDAAFTHGVSNRGDTQKNSDPDTKDANSAASKITLSGLLNCLDGVGTKEGRILFATTNRYEILDAALTRPGRMDLHIEFHNASQYQAKCLFMEFYLPDHEQQSVSEEHSSTEKESVDSGCDFVQPDVVEAADKLVESARQRDLRGETVKGIVHTERMPVMKEGVLEEFARRFSSAIPPRECSMASLQGYLMLHKSDPVGAAVDAQEWVGQQKKAKEKKPELVADLLPSEPEMPSMSINSMRPFSFLF